MTFYKAVYTATPVAGGWAGAVMSWAGAVMSWAGAVKIGQRHIYEILISELFYLQTAKKRKKSKV